MQFKHTVIWQNSYFQTIQFSIMTQFSSIRHIARTQTGATTLGQIGSDGNERVLRISQSSSVTGASPSDCLMSYPEHSLKSLTSLQRCSQCILLLQLTGPLKRRKNFKFKTWRHVFTQLSSRGRISLNVNFSMEYSWFKFRVFFFLCWLPKKS